MVVATKVCKKRVVDMHYEARIQAIISFHGSVLGAKVTKTEARTISLTDEQYLQTTPYWCLGHQECWRQLVQKWCSDEWEDSHNACRERCLMMPGVTHHQGNRGLSGYAESSSHGSQPCSLLKAYAMSHKGKAMSDVNYNPEDGPEAYSNPMVHTRLSAYTTMAREVHGPEFDPATEDLDGEVVMRVGGGKNHGRYWITDGAIDSSSTPTLSHIRARSTSASLGIRPRQDTSQYRIQALQAQLEEEMRLRVENEHRMRDMFVYMQTLGAATGVAPPPSLFASPRPPAEFSTPNQSAASNDPHASPTTPVWRSPGWRS
jgi:hypothetical protein